MRQLKLPALATLGTSRTNEQQIASSGSRFSSSSVLVLIHRCLSTEEPMKSYSAAGSSSSTGNVASASARAPVKSWKTVLGGVYVRETVKNRAFGGVFQRDV